MNRCKEFRTEGALRWRTSNHTCALTDGERHIGHVVKLGSLWHAFDATHPNDSGDGFRPIGIFAVPDDGQRAVERCYATEQR